MAPLGPSGSATDLLLSINMKYEALQVAAIFFMTRFNRDRGQPWPPCPPGSTWIRISKDL